MMRHHPAAFWRESGIDDEEAETSRARDERRGRGLSPLEPRTPDMVRLIRAARRSLRRMAVTAAVRHSRPAETTDRIDLELACREDRRAGGGNRTALGGAYRW